MERHGEDPERKRFVTLFKVLLGAYLDITEVLAGLPLPIAIAPLDDDWDPRAALPAMDRVRVVVQDEPLPDAEARRVSALILEWLAAYDMAGTIQDYGLTPWRVDALDAAMVRLAVELHIVKGLLKRHRRG